MATAIASATRAPVAWSPPFLPEGDVLGDGATGRAEGVEGGTQAPCVDRPYGRKALHPSMAPDNAQVRNAETAAW